MEKCQGNEGSTIIIHYSDGYQLKGVIAKDKKEQLWLCNNEVGTKDTPFSLKMYNYSLAKKISLEDGSIDFVKIENADIPANDKHIYESYNSYLKIECIGNYENFVAQW